ncbi:uncharacterized protein LOC133032300 [Cannabis sativa]|uniref:uncharacterized protein LOC133032300 n=1 Tax=Cannabis sativa TaxID=3483 RepID=UPI0029C9E204|nr:uncharacterized protein LOC133032300 [Cannabis sativa]
MFNELNPGIVRPEIQAPQFELKPVMFQMLQTMGQFSGMPTKDPHLDLRSFLEVSDSFKIQGVSEEVLRLKLFPFLLRDRARSWLNTLPPDSVTNWNDLAEKFLRKYFPPTRNAKFRSEIMSFQQLEDESTSDAWERLKELLRKCPHHGISHCILMETFYNGLNAASRMVLDASANGAILSKSYNEAFEILETIASNNYQWSNTRAQTSRKVLGVLEVDAITALTTQMASMTNVLKNLSFGNSKNIQPAAAIQSDDVSCLFCGGGHVFKKCPSSPESVCYMGNQNFNRNNGAFSKSYNQAWKNHPNLSWGWGGSRSKLKKCTSPRKTSISTSQAASLRNHELQLGHLANELKARPQGSLPSDTENPRRDGKEQCKSIQLRSGKHLKNSEEEIKGSWEPTSIQINEKLSNKTAQEFADTSPVDTATGQQPNSQQSAPISKIAARWDIQKVFRCVEATPYQYSLGGSIGANAELCQVLKRYYDEEKEVRGV